MRRLSNIFSWNATGLVTILYVHKCKCDPPLGATQIIDLLGKTRQNRHWFFLSVAHAGCLAARPVPAFRRFFAEDATMIRFACPKCHKPFQVDDKAAGKTSKCPQCGGPFTVPALPKARLLPTLLAVLRPQPRLLRRREPWEDLPLPGPNSAGLRPKRRARRVNLGCWQVWAPVPLRLVAAAALATLWMTGQTSQQKTDVAADRADVRGHESVSQSPSPSDGAAPARGMPRKRCATPGEGSPPTSSSTKRMASPRRRRRRESCS